MWVYLPGKRYVVEFRDDAMSEPISFFVPGVPQPGGSKKGFNCARTGRVVVKEDCKKSGPWRDRVALYARDHHDGDPLSGPLKVIFAFVVPRPKGHFGSGRNAEKLLPWAPAFPTTRPDTTKLIRASEDALKGVLWGDDSQIVRQFGTKDYGSRPGLWVTVESLGNVDREGGGS